jgi:two-component system chemotaxis sensor kinase CheA
LHQLPKQLKHGDRDFEIAYRPIADADDRLINLLVVLSDVTAKLAAQRSEAEQREIATVFERILRDKSGVIEFLLDADATVRELTAEERLPLHEIKRKLHTLKGNAAVYGMQSLSTQCHGIETRMEDAAGDMSPADQKALSVTWTRTAELLRNLLGDRKQGIVVDDEEYATVLRALLEGASRSEVFRQIREWSMERASDRLERFANQARDLGRRLRKGDVRVDVDGGGLRLPREEWAPFWTAFTHAVRNAVDHGLESPADRVAKGKPEQGRIRLSAGRAGREVLIELADDGKGIDWERVAERARAAGLPCQRESDLVAAVFADGLSTRTAVSEVSGRGVGLGALKQACERLGGYVTLQSARDEGTTFRFHMPIPERGQSLHPPESLRPKTVPTIAGPS